MPGHVRARGKRKDGSTIWQARWRPADDAGDGNREERNFKTKREAERWVASRDSDVLRGAYAPAKRGELLLSSLADELRRVWTAKRLEPKTRAGYEAILSKWLVGDADPLHPARPCRFRSVKVGAVTTKLVQDFVEEVGAARAPNTVRRIFGVLNSLMRLAAQRGYVAVNPCDAVELPTKKRAGVRRAHIYLEGPQLRALADALPEIWRLPVLLDGSCGLRAGEVWALRLRDVDLLHRELSVRFALKEISSSAAALDSLKGLLVGHPKSAASRRRLSIPTPLVPLIETWLASPRPPSEHGYAVAREDPKDENRAELDWTDDAGDPDRLLFTTARGYPVRHDQFYTRIFRPAITGRKAQPARRVRNGSGTREIPARPAVPAALPPQLHGLRFHDLRHTAAALSLAVTPNLHVVKERLGHENIATTVDLYGKRVPSVDAAIADAVGDSIFNAPNVTLLREASGD